MADADGSVREILAYLQYHESAISLFGVGSRENTESGEHSLHSFPSQIIVGMPTKLSYVRAVDFETNSGRTHTHVWMHTFDYMHCSNIYEHSNHAVITNKACTLSSSGQLFLKFYLFE